MQKLIKILKKHIEHGINLHGFMQYVLIILHTEG